MRDFTSPESRTDFTRAQYGFLYGLDGSLASTIALNVLIMAPHNISYTVVLDPPDLPINITPCLAIFASYSCSTFSFCLGLNYSFFITNSMSMAASSKPYLISYSSRPGNKSLTKPLNRGRSVFISFGSVENCIARIRIWSSF